MAYIPEDPKISSIVKTNWLVLDLVGTWFSRIGNRPEPPRNVTLRAVSQPQKIGTSIQNCQIYHHWIMPIYPTPPKVPPKKICQMTFEEPSFGPTFSTGRNQREAWSVPGRPRSSVKGWERKDDRTIPNNPCMVYIYIHIYLHLPYFAIKNNQM